jgi:3-isopropylmalate/(R)-2-methylmalate dehydratase small subunit
VKPVHVVEGTGVPLNRSDVDTDQIIPSDWLKRVERTGFGRGLFSEWRDDTTFVLNDPNYASASILVAGPRFGTGSSREHAVWALMDYGFTAVVAPSFGDIFKNNSSKQGLLTVEIDEVDVTSLMNIISENPNTLITIDVANATIEIAALGWSRHFELSRNTRERLLNGWDDIGLTLRHESEITTFESHHDLEALSLRGIFDAGGHVVHYDQSQGEA